MAFDSFTIDLGWSDPHGVWDIDRRMFPEEFAKIQAGAEAMGSRLGLWTSPSSCYPPAVDPQWALEHGYEGAINNMLSLAGEKYRNKYASTIADYVARFKLAQIKLDGLYLGGPDFLAGPFPSEATGAGAAEAFDRMRAAGPDVWLEATYSAYASPWWLFHVNSVIGCFGDDSPHGRVPCPVYRESYTTARDYFNLQGADRLPAPFQPRRFSASSIRATMLHERRGDNGPARPRVHLALPESQVHERSALGHAGGLMQLVPCQRRPAHGAEHAAAAADHVAARGHSLAVAHGADAARTLWLCPLGSRSRARAVAQSVGDEAVHPVTIPQHNAGPGPGRQSLSGTAKVRSVLKAGSTVLRSLWPRTRRSCCHLPPVTRRRLICRAATEWSARHWPLL